MSLLVTRTVQGQGKHMTTSGPTSVFLEQVHLEMTSSGAQPAWGLAPSKVTGMAASTGTAEVAAKRPIRSVLWIHGLT